VSIGVKENCYATGWSYGEICVGCNCCGRIDKDKNKIRKAKLKYARYELYRNNHFNSWGDTKDVIDLQKKNTKINKEYWRKEIDKLKGRG